MITTHTAAPGIDVLTSQIPIPGLGTVPVNAFVLHGDEPLLVDTGALAMRDEFLAALRTVTDPVGLRWIWLTHPDFDHIGSLHALIEDNPGLRVITTFLGVGMLSTFRPLPMDQVYLVNPGQQVTIGGRVLTAVKPPAFDNPATTGFVEHSSRTLFSSDCFGALLQDLPEQALDLSAGELTDGQVLWATIDSPWLHKVDRATFTADLDRVRAIEPSMILSSHLPPAPGSMIGQLLGSLAAVPGAAPFTGPDQAAFQAMFTQLTGPAAA